MKLTKTTVSAYATQSPAYKTYTGFRNGIYDPSEDPKTRHVYGETEIVYKVCSSVNTEVVDLVPYSHFDDGKSAESDALGYYSHSSLGSVTYRNGTTHHNYNGVYHAKADGTLSSKVIIDANDPNKGKDGGYYNFFTGQRGPEYAWIGPGGVDILRTANKRGYTYYGDVPAEAYAQHHTFTVRFPHYMVVAHYGCSAQIADRDRWGNDNRSRTSVTLQVLVMTVDGKTVKSSESDLYFRDASFGFLSWAGAHGYLPHGGVVTSTSQQIAFDAYIDLVNEDGVRAYIQETYKSYNTPYAKNMTYSAKSADVNVADLSNRVAQLCQKAENEYLYSNSLHFTDWNDLAFRAYQDIGMWDGNGMQYLSDLAHLSADTKRLLKTLQSLGGSLKGKKLKAACKAASATYLSVHYGIKLALSDTKELAKVISSPDTSFGRKKAQASTSFSVLCKETGNVWNATARYQLFYNTRKSMDNMFLEYLHMLDVVPDLSNIWDALPYSFVVDWFIKIGDVLSAIDNYSSICSRYDVEAAGHSTKFTRILDPSEIGLLLDGEVYFSVYTRSYSRVATLPVPSNLVTSTNPFTHSVEAGALLVSK